MERIGLRDRPIEMDVIRTANAGNKSCKVWKASFASLGDVYSVYLVDFSQEGRLYTRYYYNNKAEAISRFFDFVEGAARYCARVSH